MLIVRGVAVAEQGMTIERCAIQAAEEAATAQLDAAAVMTPARPLKQADR